jgi:predicted GNAT family acetyltransferase
MQPPSHLRKRKLVEGEGVIRTHALPTSQKEKKMSIYIKCNSYNVAVLDYINMNGSPQYKMITNINVPRNFRKRGIAHRLLNHVCDLADQEAFILFIYIIASRDISRNVIIKMLKKHQFNLIDNGIMCRCNTLNINKEGLLNVIHAYEME